MNYKIGEIAQVAELLKQKFNELTQKSDILKSTELKQLYGKIKTLSDAEKGPFGQEVNQLRQELQDMVNLSQEEEARPTPIDLSAPFDTNVPIDKRPKLLDTKFGSIHPVMKEMDRIVEIFYRMGFEVIESRQLDDSYHMFETLNFPEGHPARDDYDTFMTTEGLIPPAHTSTMQNRILKKYANNLADGKPIAVLIPGRVYRNEDLDAKHEHTFYQYEGIYVSDNANVGNLIASLKTFLSEYFGKELDVRTNPFYFPFTEPSFEFALSCPFCDKKGCSVCGYEGWIEILGCGMIHPNVLKMANIDPIKYTGFAWGGGIDRLVMLRESVDDMRYFESARLDFLRQFS